MAGDRPALTKDRSPQQSQEGSLNRRVRKRSTMLPDEHMIVV